MFSVVIPITCRASVHTKNIIESKAGYVNITYFCLSSARMPRWEWIFKKWNAVWFITYLNWFYIVDKRKYNLAYFVDPFSARLWALAELRHCRLVLSGVHPFVCPFVRLSVRLFFCSSVPLFVCKPRHKSKWLRAIILIFYQWTPQVNTLRFFFIFQISFSKLIL